DIGARVPVIASGGKLLWNPAEDVTLTSKSSIFVLSGGHYEDDQEGTGFAHKIIWSMTTSGNIGFYSLSGAYINIQGDTRTPKVTTLVSGTGTAADPAIIADAGTDWVVG